MSELKASDELFLKADLETKHGVIGQFLEHKGSKFSPILIADKIIAELQSKGETIETSDWINTSNAQGDKENDECLVEPLIDGKSVLDVLTSLDRLKNIFTVSNWQGNPKGMHEIAGQIPENILEKQLVDDEDQPIYGRILSSVNAATLKMV